MLQGRDTLPKCDVEPTGGYFMINLKEQKRLLLFFLGQSALLFASPFLVGGIMRALGGGGGEMFTFLILNPILLCGIAIYYGGKSPIHWNHGFYILCSGLAIHPYLLFIAGQFVPIYTVAYGLIALIGVVIGTCARTFFQFRNKEENKSI